MTETLDRRNPRKASRRAPRRRTRRAAMHRAQGLAGTLGITALGGLLPGLGFVFVGRRYLGMLVLLPTLLLGVLGGWYAYTHREALLRVAVDPTRLMIAAALMLMLLLAWVAVVVATYRMVRPLDQPRWQDYVGTAFVVVLCLVMAVPLAIGARYSMVQADFVRSVFDETVSPTRPDVSAANPWGDSERVNVLLLGGDGGVQREGIRTDSLILASMDVDTGETVLFSLPRNLMNVPFPEGSPLHDAYPEGFTGDGPDSEYMLNAVYRNVPAEQPGVLGRSDNEGADALKQAVSGALGLDVDYYILVNLAGFEQIVDAMGGVTVNVNDEIPIGGDTDRGIPPEDYLEPGPDQKLDGFEALWFARGRYGSSDYDRMERQRCMMKAIVDEANPVNLIRRYQELAAAGKEIVRTDIPQDLLPAFVDVTMKVKDKPLKSVVFSPSEEFSPGDPDYDWMHTTVEKAVDPPEPRQKPKQGGGASDEAGAGDSAEPTDETSPTEPSPDEAVEAADSCAYDPES